MDEEVGLVSLVVVTAANMRPLLAESSRSTRTQCKACASHWTSPAA